jgi:signal transduction histidine kinase/CheY-like chemotaxis protein
MQQSSSLPEQNLHINQTSALLKKTQELRADLWLEGSLNELQSCLNHCLLSADITMPLGRTTQAEIFQAIVNQLQKALSVNWVALALFNSKATVGTVSYISSCPSTHPPQPVLEIIPKKGTKLRLKLQDAIKIEDLQQMSSQKPQRAWQFMVNTSGVEGWLIIANYSQKSNCASITPSQIQLISQLMTRSCEYLGVALKQCEQILYWQQQCQQLAQFNQELERTHQLKNQFLANTSHEIRTPLSSIIGFTHLLLAQGYDPDKQRHQEYLNIIQSSGKHLLGLINDILDLSKIEANQLEVQWETVDIPSLCHNVLSLVKEKAANRGLKLHLEIEPEIKTLIADSLRLKQMLLNLLFNALKFTITGSVGLKVIQQDKWFKFTVWDTGTGISPEDQASLFQPYSQILNPACSRHEGTGLGLVVTQKLAEIHGGWLELKSEVNSGSSFTIILPQNPENKVVDTTDDNKIEGLATGESVNNHNTNNLHQNKDILLVEDDLSNAELIKIYLHRLGYQVTCVNTAAEMWSHLHHLEPAVILLDIHLPDADGLKLVQQLRINEKFSQVPIIAQTAMAMKGDRETCLNAGFNDYISKPLDLPLLGNMVTKYS